MNEYHQPHVVGPPPPPNAGQGQPPRQPPPLPGQGSGQVVRVWKKGRLFPFLAAGVVSPFLLLVGSLTVGTLLVHPKKVGTWIVVDVILAAIIICCITIALRRKVTLTSRDLTVRKVFQTQVLPLHEITDLHLGWRRPHNGFRSPRPHVHNTGDSSIDFLVLKLLMRLLPKPVRIESSGHVCRTKSFGWQPWEAMQEIAKTAQAAGSPIDLTNEGPKGVEWASERVREVRDRM